MEWFFIVLIILIIIGLLIFLFLLYSGAFYTYTIRCSVPVSIPQRFAYTVCVGSYYKVGSVCERVSNLVPHLTVCCIYYDDPGKVPSDQLRAAVGCILPTKDRSESIEKLLLEEGYTIDEFPQCTKALVTEYPYRTPLSILFAVKRVYPSLQEYITDYKLAAGPFFEIYKGDAIQFVAILEPSASYKVSKLPPLPSPLSQEGNSEDKKTQ